MSAILIHDTLQTTFPLSDAVVHEAPWQCAPLLHVRLLQLNNGIELTAVVDWLLHGPQNGVYTRFKSEVLGAHVRLNEGDRV